MNKESNSKKINYNDNYKLLQTPVQMHNETKALNLIFCITFFDFEYLPLV
jgi:hypothetical protein